MALFRSNLELAEIRVATEVKKRMKVASADDQHSDVSDRQAAVITLNVGQEYETTDHEGHTVTHRELLASDTKTSDLILESDEGRVLVPAWMFEVTYEVDAMSGAESYIDELPAGVAHAKGLHTRGELVITERFLKRGDPVDLIACLVPSDRPDITCRVEGKAEIRDRTFDEMDLGPALNAAVRGKSSPTLVYGGLGFLVLIFVFAAVALRC